MKRRCEELLVPDAVVVVSGRVSIREGEAAKLVADDVRPLTRTTPGDQVLLTFGEELRAFVEEAVMGALATYPGACPVWIDDRRIGQRYQLPKNRGIKASEDALGCLRTSWAQTASAAWRPTKKCSVIYADRLPGML